MLVTITSVAMTINMMSLMIALHIDNNKLRSKCCSCLVVTLMLCTAAFGAVCHKAYLAKQAIEEISE
jgi:hypothetical protein